jgi:hypothetical protein
VGLTCKVLRTLLLIRLCIDKGRFQVRTASHSKSFHLLTSMVKLPLRLWCLLMHHLGRGWNDLRRLAIGDSSLTRRPTCLPTQLGGAVQLFHVARTCCCCLYLHRSPGGFFTSTDAENHGTGKSRRKLFDLGPLPKHPHSFLLLVRLWG